MGRVVDASFFLSDEFRKFRQGKTIVFTNGCFDILHVGHIRYLKDARALGDALVVGLNSDASVKRLKGESRPVQTELDRAEILSSLGCIDLVSLFSDDTPLNLVQAVDPNVLVKGGDWAVDKIVGSDWVMSRGGKVQSLPFHQGRSTSNIVSKILSLG